MSDKGNTSDSQHGLDAAKTIADPFPSEAPPPRGAASSHAAADGPASIAPPSAPASDRPSRAGRGKSARGGKSKGSKASASAAPASAASAKTKRASDPPASSGAASSSGRGKKRSSRNPKGRVDAPSADAGAIARATDAASLAPETTPPPVVIPPSALDFPPEPSVSTAASGEAPHARAHAKRSEDDISIPPASADLDEHDEHFFREGERAAREAREQARAAALRPTAITGDHDMPDPRLALLASPAARERRARFQKIVKAAVAVSSVLCLAALVRVAVARSSHAEHEERAAASGAVAEAMPMAANAAPAPVATPAATPVAPAPQAEAPRQGESPSLPTASPALLGSDPSHANAASSGEAARGNDPPAPAGSAAAATPVSDVGAAAGEAAPPGETAHDAKKASRTALERGKTKDAIAAGERSVALDPTDGEAWLILGAAYQEAGKTADARRCFSECTKQGKKGPLGECRAMLQ